MEHFMRAVLRAAVTGLTLGAVGLGSAWSAAVITTPPLPEPPVVGELTAADPPVAEPVDPPRQTTSASATTFVAGPQLPDGWFLTGSATTSLVPPADRWKQAAQCSGQAPEQLYTPLTPDGCLITFDMLWANGVDPDNPIQARSIALSNGANTVVFTLLDTVGYMAAYPADLCADCGIDQIRTSLSAELGIPAQNMQISSSHTHAAPSTIAKGAAWYYEYVRDQVKASIRGAVAGLATSPRVRLETGSTRAKEFNVDRRIANRAVPDFELGWLRAFVPGSTTTTTTDGPGKKHDGTTTTTTPDQTVATFGNFAVHPTIRNANARLHSGMVGPFTRRVSEKLGGAALFMPGALGDQTPDKSFGINGIGIGLADRMLEDIAEGGTVLQSNDIVVAATKVKVPIENQFFVGALAVGYAVRDFLPPYGGEAYTVATENSGSNLPNCVGAGELHVVTPVSAIRIGALPPGGKQNIGPEYQLPVETDNVVIVQAPGELFASIGLIVKDYLSRSQNVLVQSVTNDTIGYIVPANQYDLFASQGVGLVNNAAEVGNYEEALSLGKCTGEIVTNALLDMGAQLGVIGEGEGR
jgi:hypothetical protein